MVTLLASVVVTSAAIEPQFLYYLIFSISRSALVFQFHVSYFSSIVSSTQSQCVWDQSSLDFVCFLKREEKCVCVFSFYPTRIISCALGLICLARQWNGP